MNFENMQHLIAMVIYMAAVVGIGIYFSKRANHSAENYFLGGRSLGPWVAAFSAEASDMSGWLLMGLPGLAYWTGLAEAGWAIKKPKATMFVWAKIPAGYESARAFAYELMEKTGVICVPGTAFGPGGEGHVRMALVQSEETLAEAVRRIAASGMIRK